MTTGWLSDAAIDRLRDVADFPVPPGQRYEIVEPLARGGMGTVYRGRDRELDRDVAVKVLSVTAAGDDRVARMQQEARVLARLEHPGVVPVYDVGVLEDGRIFYVMKLVLGPRLDQHAAERPLAERLRVFTRICEPVAFAHARGIVHRDLKPDNIMVGPFGEVLVLDWGAAQILEISDCRRPISDFRQISDVRTQMSDSASVIGTRGYMPPEQSRGEAVDARADVYALGGILHFLLAGAPPDASPLTGPRPLQAICRKARADAPAERYADVPSMAVDVDRFLAGEPVSAMRENTIERLARFGRKNRTAIAIIVTYLALRYLIAWLAP
jgi:eukaryotic-like serine/threonine-protein kinase